MAQREPQPDLPVRKFYREVYRLCRPPRAVSERNYDPWLDCLNGFRKYLGREPILADLNTETAAAWAGAMLEGGQSRSTINAKIARLKALSRFALRRRFATEAIDYERLRELRRLPEAWSVENMAAILTSARQATGKIVGVDADRWWVALLLVLYDTGLRRTAALGIRFNELDFTTKTLRVPAERMKNGVEQVFHLHDQTIAAIVDTLPPTREYLFPWPYKGAYSKCQNEWLRKIIVAAGLKCGPRDLFHKIRRTCATQIALKLGEHAAIHQLGHLSLVTIRNYVDPRFLANHTAARGIDRPGQEHPSTIEVETMEEPVKRIPIKLLRTLHVFQREIDGTACDVLAMLLEKQHLSPRDVRSALRAMQMSYSEFAEAIGVSQRLMADIIERSRYVSRDVNTRAKVAIGLTYTYNRRAVQETKP